MSWRIALACFFALPWVAVAIIAIARRRTLFGDRTDELSAEGADEGGFIFQHDRSNTDAHP